MRWIGQADGQVRLRREWRKWLREAIGTCLPASGGLGLLPRFRIKKRIKDWLTGALLVALCSLLKADGVRLKVVCLLLFYFQRG